MARKQKNTAGRPRQSASSKGGWQAINWQQVKQEVRQVQIQIVQAERAGNTRKVFELQDRLIRMRPAKLLAVRHVTTGNGKHTPGVDGEIWKTPEQKMEAVNRLKFEGYRPKPARRVYLPKEPGTWRPLGILTMYDRAMQALYWFTVDPIAETRADTCSYGFRKERSTADAITRCAEIWSSRSGPGWVLEADIEKCFEMISFEWLLEHIPIEQAILHAWLRAGYLDKGRFHKTTRGLPQGAVVSPTLANMTLDGLQRLLHDHFRYNAARREGGKVEIVRFADDFVVSGSSKRLLRDEVQPLLAHFLDKRGMTFSASKTRITSIKQGFAFLGFFVQKTAFGQVRITPTEKRVKAILNSIAAVLDQHQKAAPKTIIARLNPMIRGWATYYDHVDSRNTFDRLDETIYALLLDWAKRRHPGYFNRKAIKQYFVPVKGQSPCFTDGQGHTLFCAHNVPRRTHIPIPPEYNPYDPNWDRALAQRAQHHKHQRAQQRPLERSPRHT